MQMQWKISQPDADLVRKIQHHLDCHTITATVLANRGMASPENASQFMQPTLDQLPSPWELKGMRSATTRILKALQSNEKILVFGDYDADGVTATALLASFLEAAGAQVVSHLPHRIDESALELLRIRYEFAVGAAGTQGLQRVGQRVE